MHNNKIIIIFTIFVLCIMLCSCSKGETLQNSQSNNVSTQTLQTDTILTQTLQTNDISTNVNKLITTKYSTEQLEYINSLEVNLYELDTEFPIQCIKQINNCFRVIYLSENNILHMIYDDNDTKCFGRVYDFSKLKSDFSSMKIGQSLDDVMTIDPNGDYLFLYTGCSTPRISSHYTTDGYLIKITYDNTTVIDIQTELI